MLIGKRRWHRATAVVAARHPRWWLQPIVFARYWRRRCQSANRRITPDQGRSAPGGGIPLVLVFFGSRPSCVAQLAPLQRLFAQRATALTLPTADTTHIARPTPDPQDRLAHRHAYPTHGHTASNQRPVSSCQAVPATYAHPKLRQPPYPHPRPARPRQPLLSLSIRATTARRTRKIHLTSATARYK